MIVRLRNAWWLIVDIALLPGCGLRQGMHGTARTSWQSEARMLGERAVTEQRIVGCSIAVAIDGRIVFAQGFGHADFDRRVPADANTIYDIASVGKHFTSAAIMRLVDQGKLSLETPVRSILPELPAHFPNATIEQLLRHTSGFVGAELDELNPPADMMRKRYGVELLTDTELVNGSAMFEPGETWVYCNPGYLVLGIVVERVSGKRYDEFVREELLLPNGLDEMTVCERALPPRMSDGMRHTDDGLIVVPFIDMTGYAGQGSACSSAVDLLRWSHALNTGKVISVPSLTKFRAPTTVHGTHKDAEIPYGMAQRIGAIEGHNKVGHTGTFDGGSAALAYYPDDKLEIAVITNTRGGGTPHAYMIETLIAKAVLKIKDPDVASQRQPVTDTMRRAIEGVYTNGSEFTATIQGDELVVSKNGEVIERLLHVGDMRFRKVDNPDWFEWFVMDGDRAGWWVYSMSGNFLEVVRRKD